MARKKWYLDTRNESRKRRANWRKKKQLTYGHASNARWAEGPHIYKIDAEYVLLIGEGGTGEYHAVTVFNSDNIWGPYIPNHANPVMTHRHLGKDYPIQQTGHADLVQTQNGDWWSVMLAKRQVDGFTTLARETFLAKVEMTNQESGVTPIFNPGKGLLLFEQKRPELPWSPEHKTNELDEFEGEELGLEWNFLRSPKETWYELKDGQIQIQLRPESVTEFVNPSFIAQRTRHLNYEARTSLSFNTKKENEKAGLVIYRRHGNHYQLLKTKDKLVLLKTLQEGNKGGFEPQVVVSIPYKKESVVISVKVDGINAQFYYGENKFELKPMGKAQDYTILSDEIAQKFNGVYVGMYVTSSGKESKKTALFDWFKYQGVE